MATSEVDIKELLAAGAHFGHKTERWHPKMAPYIHSKRNDTHINIFKTNYERKYQIANKRYVG